MLSGSSPIPALSTCDLNHFIPRVWKSIRS
jgi:hypothetical protein